MMARCCSSPRWPCRPRCCSPAARARAAGAHAGAARAGAAAGLAAALLAAGGPPLVLAERGCRFTLALDPPGAILLGVAALLWTPAGLYAWRYLAGEPNAGRFAVWWLLTLTGSLGVFFAGDLADLLPDLRPGQPRRLGPRRSTTARRAPQRAGAIYLVPRGGRRGLPAGRFRAACRRRPGPDPRDPPTCRAAADSPWRGLTLALLIAGFGLKMGLVPLHVWLPLAHPAAPMPASAVLSGAIIKAGVIGLIRFLPFDGGAAGLGRRCSPRSACSPPSTASRSASRRPTRRPCSPIRASARWASSPRCSAWGLPAARRVAHGGRLLRRHHVLAKGALFLAVGVVAATGSAPPVAGAAAGGGAGAGLRRSAADRRRAREARGQAALGDGVVGLLATLAGGRQHAADAAFPASSAAERRRRPGSRRRRPGSPALAGAGACCRRGPLGAVPGAGIGTLADASGARRALEGALAGAARRRAQPLPAPAGDTACRACPKATSWCSRSARRARPAVRRCSGAGRRAAAAMAGRGPFVIGADRGAGCRDRRWGALT